MARIPFVSYRDKCSRILRGKFTRDKPLHSRLQHRLHFPTSRFYSTTRSEQPNPSQGNKQRSRHAAWYSDILPSMVPVALLGFVIYGVS
jgi:hypothetical protein